MEGRSRKANRAIVVGLQKYGFTGYHSYMKLILVAGPRPNFMKIAPILEAFRPYRDTRPDLSVLLSHTDGCLDDASLQ